MNLVSCLLNFSLSSIITFFPAKEENWLTWSFVLNVSFLPDLSIHYPLVHLSPFSWALSWLAPHKLTLSHRKNNINLGLASVVRHHSVLCSSLLWCGSCCYSNRDHRWLLKLSSSLHSFSCRISFETFDFINHALLKCPSCLQGVGFSSFSPYLPGHFLFGTSFFLCPLHGLMSYSSVNTVHSPRMSDVLPQLHLPPVTRSARAQILW